MSEEQQPLGDDQHSHRSYFDRLTFNPALATGWIAKYITNIRFVMLLLIAISVVGIISYLNLPQRLNPELKIPIIIITSTLPGASPTDVEALLTKPIEAKIQGLSGIDTLTSTSAENVSNTVIQFLSSVDGDKAKDDVQSAVDTLTDLPDNATTPVVRLLDFEDQPVWTFAVTADNDTRSLMVFAETLKRRLEDLPLIDRVSISGLTEQEVTVSLDPAKGATYNLNAALLAQQLTKAAVAFPAGPVKTSALNFAVTIDPQVTNVADIRDLRITVGNQAIRLGDIATVQERSKPDLGESWLASPQATGQQSVVFYVFKTSQANIIEAAASAREEVTAIQHEQAKPFTVTTIQNTAEEIDTQFKDLLGEFRTTIILVFIALLIFLGLKQALLSSLTVPLTFLASFIFLHYLNMSINFLTLFAFLLTLGLLVDDTIVVISAMTQYFRTGKFTPTQTGILVWKDTIVPIWSTTITTIWSFVPLLLATGIIGEFIKPIPIVVTVTMISSTAIAVLITLPLMVVLLKPQFPPRIIFLIKAVIALLGLAIILFVVPRQAILGLVIALYLLFLWIFYQVWPHLSSLRTRFGSSRLFRAIHRIMDHGLISFRPLENAYHRAMLYILNSKSARRKVIIMNVAYAVFAFSLLPLGLVKNEFFPKVDATIVYINHTFAPGTRLETMKTSIAPLIEQFRHYEGVDYVTAETGRGVDQQNGNQAASGVLYTLHLPPEKERSITSIELAEKLRTDVKNYETGQLSVVEMSGGPPAGADLQLKLLGNDLGELDGYANQVMEYLRKQPGITSVDKSIKPGPSKVVFVPDFDQLARNGISIDAVGLALRTYASGFTLDEINFDKNTSTKEDVVFRMTESGDTIAGLNSLNITTPTSNSVPLLALGHLEPRFNPTVITREDQRRTLSVSAGVRYGYNIPTLNKGMEDFADSLHLPVGYSWQTGGVNEENQKSVNSILMAMVVAFLLILVTMVLQFNSYRQAIIVLMVIPLAVSSVFLIFALTNTPLSFPALIGVLSLFGIVVTNSMFIVDKINLNIKEGLPFNEAIANAGSSRMEPIILTKLSTVLGLLPITLANPLWRGLGGAIISGLLIASTIMLFFIPVVYYQWFKPKTEEQQLNELFPHETLPSI